MYRLLIILFATSIFLFSCENSSSSDTGTDVTLRDIENLEGELFGDEMATPDLKKAKSLVDMYIAYANQYPKDPNSANLLFKAADISMNLGTAQSTIALFNRILMEYPDFENRPTVMFLKGFVYEDQLQDYEKAARCYMDFLETYPESDFADDAKISLDNLGKTPEELIKEFESKNK